MKLPGLIAEKFTDIYITKKKVPGESEWKIFSDFMEDQIEACCQCVADMTEETRTGVKRFKPKPLFRRRRTMPRTTPRS